MNERLAPTALYIICYSKHHCASHMQAITDLFLTRHRITQRASWRERSASSSTSLLEPRTTTETVRAWEDTPVICKNDATCILILADILHVQNKHIVNMLQTWSISLQSLLINPLGAYTLKKYITSVAKCAMTSLLVYLEGLSKLDQWLSTPNHTRQTPSVRLKHRQAECYAEPGSTSHNAWNGVMDNETVIDFFTLHTGRKRLSLPAWPLQTYQSLLCEARHWQKDCR